MVRTNGDITGRLLTAMAVGAAGAWAVGLGERLAGRAGYPLAGATEAVNRGLGLYLSEGQRRGLASGLLCLAGAAGGALSALVTEYVRE